MGLAYKIAEALVETLPTEGVLATEWLDLVALGTVADVVPLTGENRVLVRRGLEVIRSGSRLGIRMLANIASIDIQKVNSTDIGFKLGPRLNASGRVETAESAYKLLISTDASEAGDEARNLDALNYQRQKLTAESVIKAEQNLVQSNDGAILFAADKVIQRRDRGVDCIQIDRSALPTFHRWNDPGGDHPGLLPLDPGVPHHPGS